MKRYLFIGFLAVVIATPAWAQRGRGGSGGGSIGGRGGFTGGSRGGFTGGSRGGFSGAGRGAMVRPPTSRPSFSPSFSGARPQFNSPGSSVRPNLPSMQGVRPPIQSSPGIGPRTGDSITRQYSRPFQPGMGGVGRGDVNRSIGPGPNLGIDRRSNIDWNRYGSRAPWDGNRGGDWRYGQRGDWNRGQYGNWNRGQYGDWNRGRHGNWHNGDWYGHYHDYHPWARNWWGLWGLGYLPWFWGGGGWWDGGGWWPGSDVVYYNPYYVQTTLLPAPIDYSQPLPSPDTTSVAVQDNVQPPPDPAAAEAAALLDQGRAAFSLRDYQTALARVDEAIRKLPSDAALHEFRALTLFAMQRYSDAAAAIYAVLSTGPGWNWTTVSALYADPNEYTSQLRALEAFVGSHPSDAASRFLLGYHYLVIGSRREAADQLREVTRLSPTDAVSAELLKSLTTPIDT